MNAALDRVARQIRPEALGATALALVALLGLAAYLYVLAPQLAEYRELLRDRTRAAVGIRSDQEEPALPALVGLGDQVARLRTRLYGGSSGVPLREMESYVIQSLDRISARHEVELVGVRPREAGQVLMFDELPYDVEVAGSYVQLWRWLQDVETELRPMVVNAYELERKAEGPVRMSLRLVAYRGHQSGP